MAISPPASPRMRAATPSSSVRHYSEDFPTTASCGSFRKDQLSAERELPTVRFRCQAAQHGDVRWTTPVTSTARITAIEARVALFPAGCGTLTACKAYVVGSTQSDTTSGFPVNRQRLPGPRSIARTARAPLHFLVAHERRSIARYATLYGGSGNGANAETGLAVAVNTKAPSSPRQRIHHRRDFLQRPPNTGRANGRVRAAHKCQQRLRSRIRTVGVNGPASLVYSTYLGGCGAEVGGTLFIIAVGDVGTGIAYRRR